MKKNLKFFLINTFKISFVLWTTLFALIFFHCSSESGEKHKNNEKRTDGKEWWRMEAKKMVEEQIKKRGISDKKVLHVMEEIPRHRFLPEYLQKKAYSDQPLPIGEGQTISQPYIVALMTDLLNLKGDEHILEIGTGSGYQAAILANLADNVYSIEIIHALAERAKKTLTSMSYDNIHVKIGDGYKGWPEFAPFDCIIVTAAPKEVPEVLVEQLKVGGRMVIPVGVFFQELLLIEKSEKGIKKKKIIPVRFVPMVHP